MQQIQQDNSVEVQIEIEKYQQQAITDIDRLHQLKQEALLAQQRKVMKEVLTQIIHTIFQKVNKQIKAKCENAQYQKRVTNFYIHLFRKYKS